MNIVCCTPCRLRFTRSASANLSACPECGGPPQSVPATEKLLGFRLYTFDDSPEQWLQARAVALPVPDPGEHRP